MCCNNNSQVCILVIMQDILTRDAAGGSSTAAVPAAGKPSFGLQSGNAINDHIVMIFHLYTLDIFGYPQDIPTASNVQNLYHLSCTFQSQGI